MDKVMSAIRWPASVLIGAVIGFLIYQMYIRKQGNGEPLDLHIYRSSSDRKIAGVCGGIAAFLHTSSTVIRLVFVVMMLCWGSGLQHSTLGWLNRLLLIIPIPGLNLLLGSICWSIGILVYLLFALIMPAEPAAE